MILEIVTPEKIIFSGEAQLVRVPGSSGSFAMLRNHAPIISTLQPGMIKIKITSQETLYFDLIEPAVVENHDNRIVIMAEKIESTTPPESKSNG